MRTLWLAVWCLAGTAGAHDPSAQELAVPIEPSVVAPALPDLTVDLPRGKCDNGPGGPGADSVYTGEITLTEAGFSGVEVWHLFKNRKWTTPEAKDCTVTYSMTGTQVPPLDCPDCDVALWGLAEVVIAETDCPPALWREVRTRRFQVDYGIHRRDDGSAQFYFNHGGNPIYTGHHAGNKVVYRSSHACLWF
jgi:hypothetical protein